MKLVVLLFLFESFVTHFPQLATKYNPKLSEAALVYVTDAISKIVLWLIISVLVTTLGQVWSRFKWVRAPIYGVAGYSMFESYLRVLCRTAFPLTGPPPIKRQPLCHAAGYYDLGIDLSTWAFCICFAWILDIWLWRRFNKSF